MAEKWRPFDGECDHCGCGSEVLTASGRDGFAYDGDLVRCDECGFPGTLVVEEDDVWIHWHDDCDCKRCLEFAVKEIEGGA